MSQLNTFKGTANKIAKLLDEGKENSEVMKLCSCSSSEVYRVLNSAIFQDWQRSQALSQLGGRGARVAIQTLLEVAGDKTLSGQARVSASDKLLHYTGLKLNVEGELDKSPSSMSAADLLTRLAELQKESANRGDGAKVIEASVEEDEDVTLDDLL